VEGGGAIMFRGFPLHTAEDFAAFTQALGYPNFTYEGSGGNAVRRNVIGDRVFTANESPPDRPIPFHHELAQSAHFPERVLFFCDVPAASGGATPLLDSHRVYTRWGALGARTPGCRIGSVTIGSCLYLVIWRW